MTLFKNKYRSESHRLQGWDYSQDAIYFLTICIEEKECLLGKVENTEMVLNEYGLIVEDEIKKSIAIRDNMKFHSWVIMPNHIHLLIEIIDVHTHCRAYPNRDDTHVGAYLHQQRKPKSISSFVSGLKSTTTKQINIKRNTPFQKVWLNNYHDHIVQDDNSFHNIYDYIESNPLTWDDDEHNKIK